MAMTEEQLRGFATNYVEHNDAQPEELKLTPAERHAVERSKAEAAEFMLMKASLIETTASRGWPYVLKFAESVIRDLEREAIAEEDDAKANGMRRDARGARKFKDELLRRIDIAKLQDPSTFIEVITH